MHRDKGSPTAELPSYVPGSPTPPTSLQDGLPESLRGERAAFGAESSSPTFNLRTPAARKGAQKGSSPALPSLPVLTDFGARIPTLASSPPSEPPTDSRLYYTASWGSPYQRLDREQDLINDKIPRRHRHNRTVSSDGFLDSSPSLKRELGVSSDASRRNSSRRIDRFGDLTPKRPSGVTRSPTLKSSGRQPAQSLAKDRVSHYLSGISHSERHNWWSDDSADGGIRSSTAQPLHGPPQEDLNRSSDFDEFQDFVSPWTVELRSTLNSTRNQGPRHHRSKRSNETLKQRDFWQPALRLKDSQPTASNMQSSRFADTPSPLAGPVPAMPTPEAASSAESQMYSSPEKPLPPPPFPERKSSIQDLEPTPTPARPTHRRMPTMSSSKKRVPWKGKNCVISVPSDDRRGQDGFAPTPLTKPEVERRLESWQDRGFDTRGFGYWNQRAVINGSEGEGQTRSVFPDPGDLYLEGKNQRAVVSVPDRKEWEAYVNRLNEDRLRALGVSFGDEEEPPSISPAPSSMSRQMSSQLLGPSFSPPLPTSSVTSNQAPTHPGSFSPPFAGFGSTDPSSRVASIASPVSINALNSQYSVPDPNAGRDRTFSSPFQAVPQQATPPIRNAWPAHNMQPQNLARGGSPAMLENLQSLGEVLSPNSGRMDNHNQQNTSVDQPEGNVSQSKYEYGQAKPASSAQIAHFGMSEEEDALTPHTADSGEKDSSRAGPILDTTSAANQSTRSVDFVDENPAVWRNHAYEAASHQFRENGSGADPTSPFDTGDMQIDNSSFTELLGNDEPAFTQAAYDQNAFPAGKEQQPQESVRSSTLHHPQPHARAHSLSQRRLERIIDPFHDSELASESLEDGDANLMQGQFADRSLANSPDLETNPSASGSPAPEIESDRPRHSPHPSTVSNPWSGIEQVSRTNPPPFGSHTAKSSLSKWNVGAKEFQFDPTSSFTPGNFSFSSNSFQPAKPASNGLHSAAASRHGHSNRVGSESSRGGGLNVSAAAFEPSRVTGNAFPTGDFSFSSSGPQFRPNAPTFDPESHEASDNPPRDRSSALDRPTDGKDKIFNMSGFVKPTKRSKAIPIVRPDNNVKHTSSNEGEEAQEDEFGRITQGDGRLKRARHFDDSQAVGNRKTPLNATFTESKQNQLPAASRSPTKTPSPGKENTLEINGVPTSSSRTASLPLSSPTELKRTVSALSEHDSSGWAPYEFSKPNEARDFNDARPSSPLETPGDGLAKLAHSDESDEDMDILSVQQAELAIEADEMASRAGSHEGSTERQEVSSGEHSAAPESGPNGFRFDFDAVSSQDKLQSAPKKTLRDSMFAASESSEQETIEVNASKKAISSPTESERAVEEVGLQENERLAERPSNPEPRELTSESNVPDSSPHEILSSKVTRNGPAWSPDQLSKRNTTYESSPLQQPRLDLKIRSDAPSPSPRRIAQSHHRPPYEVAHLDGASSSHGLSDPERAGVAYDSPVHKLNSPGQRPVSDWDDVLSSSDEYKFHARSRFFDHHVDSLVGGLLEERLGPLERAMRTIERSVTTIAADRTSSRKRTRSVSVGIVHSDADDEDDESTFQQRPKSPRKDIRVEKLRSVVMEALASQQSAQSLPPAQGLDEIHHALAEMRSSFSHFKQPQHQADGLRDMFEEVLNERYSERQRSSPGVQETEIQELTSRNVSLEQMLQKANARIEQEIDSRRDAEERLFETQRDLRTMQEADDRRQGLADENDQRVQAFDHDMQQDLIHAQMQTAFLEGVRENLQKSSSELSAKNAELESNLMESGMKENRLKEEVERMTEEGGEMRKMLDSMRTQMEESVRVRESLRGKFDDLQGDVTAASRNLKNEQEAWARRDEEHNVRHEVMKARLEAEARTRERLERELERLEAQEREAMKLRVHVEQAQSANANLENVLSSVRLESIESQQRAARFEQEFKEAREAGRVEISRARILFDAEIEAANNQVNVVRADLESELGRVRGDFEHFKLEADTAKARAELVLEEAYDSKMKAIQEAAEDRERALNEQSSKFERHMEDTKFQQDRALENALEDKQRDGSHMLERLSLSDSKIEHLQEKVGHLEEKLEIAKSAANAAAQAAQVARVAPLPAAAASVAKGSEIPEKISPQALRESILVLQEQLQEREGRIEKLEQEVNSVDRDAPEKIKSRENEIGWLRELLGVRIGDLQDIVNTLSQPTYDREAVKDAAIRLKANMEMEQQEKERAMKGGQTFPSLASISSFASPKAVLPLAAAWGNWRKGKEGVESAFADFTSSRNQTPSKSSPSAQSFLSGLMTPPNTNLRQTPEGSNTAQPRTAPVSRMNQARRPPSSSISKRAEKSALRPPTTPPLLRHASYDQDAESGDFGTSGFDDDDESAADGSVNASKGPEEPFGPGIRM